MIHDPGAVERLNWASNAEHALRRFRKESGTRPRIAIFGVPPLIHSYRPASEVFEAHSVPIRVFDTLEQAIEWL